MSITPENSSTGWPSFGEHFNSTRDSTHRLRKEGAQVTISGLVQTVFTSQVDRESHLGDYLGSFWSASRL
jgi:hypothetical protein